MCRKNGEQEELDPQLVHSLQQRGICTHQERERLAVAELVVAPFFEPAENRMKLPLRMPLKLSEDRDVAGVSNLLRKVGRIEDELRLEVSVFLRARQKAEINADAMILEDLIDEPRMTSLIPAHVAKELLNVRILDALLDLCIQNAA